MERFEQTPNKTEIDGAIESLCFDHDCGIKYMQGHLTDGSTWMFRPVIANGEVDLEMFVQELDLELNSNDATNYAIRIDDTPGPNTNRYIRLEKLNT